jgi:hypothetical protein
MGYVFAEVHPNAYQGALDMKRDFRFVKLALVLAGFLTSSAAGNSLGHLAGLVQDSYGQPLPNVLVTLFQKSPEEALPIMARTDRGGHVFIRNLESGAYTLRVRNADYRFVPERAVDIISGRTAVVKLVLEDLIDARGMEEGNLGIKGLLRNAADRRLIFRDLPGEPGSEFEKPPRDIFDSFVFQLYTDAGFGGDYLVFPSDSSGGTTTNFAVSESLGGNSTYVFAGQLNSGEDSLWRLRNLVDYQLSDRHSFQVFLGYSRVSFDPPSLALLGNPIAIGDDIRYMRSLGTTTTMSAGFEDRLTLHDSLSVIWGLELSQVRHAQRYSFASPNAAVLLTPRRGTDVKLTMSSRRPTYRNQITLPDGQAVSIGDPVYLARVGEHFTLGVSRHYQALLGQMLSESDRVELALFNSRLFAGSVPVLAVFGSAPGMDVLQLDDGQAESLGYRATYSRRFSPHLRTSFSFLRGSASGLASQIIAAPAWDELTIRQLIGRRDYHGLAAEIEAFIPQSGTQVTAVMKAAPWGSPITTLDALSDLYDTGNQGMNLFVRQKVPVPATLFGMLGLDFLPAHQLEALIDVRNLRGENLGVVRTPTGDVVLLRNPRVVRGGISVRF